MTKMSAAQVRYARALAACEVAVKTENEIIAELTTADMTEDDETALFIAAFEAAGLSAAIDERSAAEESLVAWARNVVAKKHDLTPDLDRLMTADWKKLITTREKLVDLCFRLAA